MKLSHGRCRLMMQSSGLIFESLTDLWLDPWGPLGASSGQGAEP